MLNTLDCTNQEDRNRFAKYVESLMLAINFARFIILVGLGTETQ